MTCYPPTSKQKKYAKHLVRRLREKGPKYNRYIDGVRKCICIADMSDLIDEMKDELED